MNRGPRVLSDATALLLAANNPANSEKLRNAVAACAAPEAILNDAQRAVLTAALAHLSAPSEQTDSALSAAVRNAVSGLTSQPRMPWPAPGQWWQA